MKNTKQSLYTKLVIIIIFTVTITMAFHATYNYINTKNKVIEEIKENSRMTIVSLKSNITNLLASYAVNEYENLILNEIKNKDIFAIVIDDYNMGKLVGEKSYTTGKVKSLNKKIYDYDVNNQAQNDKLKESFYMDTFDIVNTQNETIGVLSIYISDTTMNKELNKIIEESIIDTIIISILLILFLFISIRLFILKPISNIIEIISNKDSDGIPLKLLKDNNSKEMNELSTTINNMIHSVKSSREVLKASEYRLTHLLEMSPIAVRIAKNNGETVIFSNFAYSRLIKNYKTRFRNPKDYYADKKVYEDIIFRLKNKKDIYNKLVKLNIDNKTTWALASYMNLEYDHEECIIGWFYDVTEEKENELKLFEALNLQTAIFDNSGYLMIRTDKDGLIKQINKEVEKLLGYKAEELIDKHTPVFLHPKQEIEKRTKLFSKELNKEIQTEFETLIIKSDLNLDNEYEWTYITKQGKEIPVLLSITTLKDKNNQTQGYIGIAKDLTQRKILESQAKLASMGEMIGNIAHQWRQPLSVISTIASGITVKSEFGKLELPSVLEDMESIIKQSKYLSKTIDDFRNFIKNTNNKEKVSVLSILDKTLSIVNSSIVNNNITIVTCFEDDGIIDGYENQLIQAIINIINNAKDALNENTKDKYIFMETKKDKDTLSLSIRDNAGGIPDGIIEKIFEPYFTTKHQSIGTGIGLSITHQIITKHHDAVVSVHNETYKYNNEEFTGANFEIIFRTI